MPKQLVLDPFHEPDELGGKLHLPGETGNFSKLPDFDALLRRSTLLDVEGQTLLQVGAVAVSELQKLQAQMQKPQAIVDALNSNPDVLAQIRSDEPELSTRVDDSEGSAG